MRGTARELGSRFRNLEEPVSLFPWVVLSPRANNLKVKDLRGLVRNRPNPRRYVDELAKCVEKGEMVEFVNRSIPEPLLLILGRKLLKAVTRDNINAVLAANQSSECLFAENKFFSSYVVESLDATRTVVTFEEMVDRNIDFYFKQERTTQHYRQNADNIQFFANAKFCSNNEFEVDHHSHNV